LSSASASSSAVAAAACVLLSREDDAWKQMRRFGAEYVVVSFGGVGRCCRFWCHRVLCTLRTQISRSIFNFTHYMNNNNNNNNLTINIQLYTLHQ
jgi:hypothetical protein